jgi:hypothetical protein
MAPAAEDYVQGPKELVSVFGEVVDRSKWEGGCIVEHVSVMNG